MTKDSLQTPLGNFRWTICGLLFFATTVNYLDRAVLSLLKPELSGTFGWTETDYGNISACFTLVYAFSMVFAGRIIDKLGTKLGFILRLLYGQLVRLFTHILYRLVNGHTTHLRWLASLYFRLACWVL